MRQHNRPRRAVMLVIAALAVAAGSVAAYAQASGGNASSAGPIAQIRTVPAGPRRLARAAGVNPSQAKPVFVLANGQTAAVTGNTTARCLLLSGARGPSETCGTIAAIDEGQAISVTDECGSAGNNLMEITGLAPEGAATARLQRSDGSHEDVAVEEGAFKFQGTNPGAGAAYPTGVQWVGAGGASLGGAELPVRGDEFCITPPEPPSGP